MWVPSESDGAGDFLLHDINNADAFRASSYIGQVGCSTICMDILWSGKRKQERTNNGQRDEPCFNHRHKYLYPSLKRGAQGE